jgi:putative sigma-54 modulation protein
MQVQVHFQGLDSTPWMNQFITSRVAKLERYLNPSARIHVHLKFSNRKYITSLSIHNINHDYAYTSDGQNLFESFTLATDKATRALGEHKRMIKDKINRKYQPLKQQAVA